MTAITLPATVQHEFNDLMLGEKLGQGTYREVYAFRPDPKLVVKLELGDTKFFANVSEWAVWNELRGTEWERYLAPCRWISHSGSVLIQERTEPIKRMPKQLPNFMADLKRKNFGKLGNRVVAHDYGNHRFYCRGLRNAKLVDVRDDDW